MHIIFQENHWIGNKVTKACEKKKLNSICREIEDDGAVGYDNYFVEPGGFNGGSIEANPLAAENFPTLGGDSNNTGTRTVSNVTITSKVNPLSEENFPSLSNRLKSS